MAKELTLSPGFYMSENTVGEGEIATLLVTSNFSFSHSVFYLFRELSAIFIKFEIIICEIFQFGRI